MMMSLTLLLATLGLLVQGSSAEIILTQIPKAQSAVPGQTVSVRCKSSTTISDDIDWYLQKSGEAPKLLIADTTSRRGEMSTTGSSLNCEGMYSKLIDNEPSHDELPHRPDVGHSVHPVMQVGVFPRPSGPGSYRLATICLAALCAVLLISIIAVSAHYKSKPQGGGEASFGKQTQEANVSALTAAMAKLQQEKQQLQKEKDELQAKLAAKVATKAPAVVTPARIVCPNDWHLFNNSCYLISRNSRDWPESKSFCESKGAHLAIIHTAEEQTFLWNLLPRGHWNSYWFGITDGQTEDEWKWVDGTPVIGGFWEDGEPNNHINEDCGYIVKTNVLERVAIRSWYDAPCSMYLPFICEKEMGPSASTAIPH